jgi:hypothetical protein
VTPPSSKSVAFERELAHRGAAGKVSRDHLDGDVLGKPSTDPAAEIDHAHATAAELTFERERPHRTAEPGIGRFAEGR